jgi:hypothetical protein
LPILGNATDTMVASRGPMNAPMQVRLRTRQRRRDSSLWGTGGVTRSGG